MENIFQLALQQKEVIQPETVLAGLGTTAAFLRAQFREGSSQTKPAGCRGSSFQQVETSRDGDFGEILLDMVLLDQVFTPSIRDKFPPDCC